ncbi:hypothetical protein C1646_769016 [Rhizophagus diaphanus]|nr:hypothetical protein C1646_769016 [Rhizophagus diaphanus] [Rhizophagus sp. MUCL 43196]
MADIYDALEEIKNKYEIEKHIESREEYQTDPSLILEAISYNKNTIEKWLEYVKLTRKEGEIYSSNIEIGDYRKMGITSVIKVICEHYVFYEDDNMTLDDKVEENLLENRELLTYRYIIEDDELDMRFTKFEEWLEETGIAEVKNRGYNTMKYFKEILHMEESIAEKENREKVKKFQKNMIITKIIEEKGFIEEYSDVKELISSDDTEESENLDEYFEMILRNYWIENSYEIDIKEIIQILDFGIKHKIMKTKDFMEYYMILIKETMDYNKEFEGRICKSCFEKEENNNKIKLRIERIMKICETLKVETTREEIIQLLKMGYEDKKFRKEINTEENENEETTNEITETEEKLRKIKGLIKYLEIEATEGELLMLIQMGYTDSNIIIPPDDAFNWSFIKQSDMVYNTEYTADDDDLNFDDDELDAILANKKDMRKKSGSFMQED